MSAIGSLVFCTDCGSLLDRATGPQQTELKCTVCGAICKDTSEKTIVTRSKPSAFPSSLRAKRSEIQTAPEGESESYPRTQVPCSKCGREEVGFYEMQLRSADEGSTIFYVCDCGNRWNENN
ncbi:DNA-directed RNA polymeras-like protein I subunit [Myriangium duriaei CBS 260.36]|uniref:DNA-directed RNA polymerase subunit n=1 Tax=Myriangium duriaei CBS 260.36 TaxID=1168546 RepID=A0A9P4MIN8_9PEZI|nr:DNA-directed RNA polymeras-like protein I subunit [Myriangium duriaei CBS 260.36]